MNIPEDLKYSEDDEWVRVEGDIATIGITDYAQEQLNDIVYLELPSEGDSFDVGETFGVVESVKAASDLMMPIGGVVSEANEDLLDAPELINSDPFGEAWMIKVNISDASALEKLMDAKAYKAYIDSRA